MGSLDKKHYLKLGVDPELFDEIESYRSTLNNDELVALASRYPDAFFPEFAKWLSLALGETGVSYPSFSKYFEGKGSSLAEGQTQSEVRLEGGEL